MENTQIIVNQICPSSTQAWVKRGALLVDVREKEEVAELSYDVPNIINVPLTEFENRYIEIPTDKEVVVVCKSGSRSLRATGFLIHKGWDNTKVVNMKHGIVRWVHKGFATKGDTTDILANTTNSGCCSTKTSEHKSDSCCGSDHKEEKGGCCHTE